MKSITVKPLSQEAIQALKVEAKKRNMPVTFSKGTATKAVRGSINIRFNPTGKSDNEIWVIAQQIASFCNEFGLTGSGTAGRAMTRFDCCQSGAWYLFQKVS